MCNLVGQNYEGIRKREFKSDGMAGKTSQNGSRRRFRPESLFGEREGSGCASACPIFKIVPMRHYYQINT